MVTKGVGTGVYYLYARGLDRDAIKNTHFIGLNSYVPNIKLSTDFFLWFSPQVYYLNQVTQDGFYVTWNLSLLKKGLPLSLTSMVNAAIKTNIRGSEPFAWNLILTYFFQ